MAKQPNRTEQKETLGALQESGSNFGSEIRDTVKDVNKVIAASERLAAKLDSMSASEINTKNIAKELLKAKEKQLLIQYKLSNIDDASKQAAQKYLRSLKDRSTGEKKLQDLIQSGTKKEIKAQQELLITLEKQIQKQGESAETIQAAALMQQSEEASYMVEATQQRLDIEEKISKQLGITGGLIGKVAKNLGIGDAVYTSMVKKAKELNGEASVFQIAGAGLKGGLGAGVDMLKSLDIIPIIGGVVSGIVKGFKTLLDFLLEVEDRTVKFGRALGYSREQSKEIALNFAKASEEGGDLLVTSKAMMEVQSELSSQLEINNIFSNEMLATQIKLKQIMGLGAEEMGKLAEASIITGKSQKDVVTGTIAQVTRLSQVTGITFDYKKILKEASTIGGTLGLQFAKYPEKLTKALVATKALGMDLKKVDDIAGSLLDFETTIQNQLEAQLITGKEINLSRAMQLSLENKTSELAGELADKLGTSQEYLNMNRIAAESYAKAVGMTRDELADVLKQQELLSKIGAKDTDNSQRRLELAVKRYQTEDKARKALGEDVYNNMVQLSVQEKIAALIEKVKTSIQDFILKSGVVDKIQEMMDYLTSPSNVKSLISIIKDGVATVADMIQGIAVAMLHIAEVFTFGDADKQLKNIRANISESSFGDNIRYSGRGAKVSDFRLQPLPEDTISTNGVTIEGGTRLGRTDEMVDVLKQILAETKQGKSMQLNIDGSPIATVVAKNAPNLPSASNLGPRPLR